MPVCPKPSSIDENDFKNVLDKEGDRCEVCGERGKMSENRIITGFLTLIL